MQMNFIDTRPNMELTQSIPLDTECGAVSARFLAPRDISALLDLEHAKWNSNQVASEAELLRRIYTHPHLSMGAFCSESGQLISSLFMKPVADDFYRNVATWNDCLAASVPEKSSSLFGISLSSRHQHGVDALLRFFWPKALKGGWRYIYLGSPVPGLSSWLRSNPGGRPEDYVFACRGKYPLDPQLRYYHKRGFTKIVTLKPDYFPHKLSLDYGALLRGTVPLSILSLVWKALSLPCVERITRPLAGIL